LEIKTENQHYCCPKLVYPIYPILTVQYMLVCPVLTGIERGVKPRINFKVLSRHIPLVFRCIIRSQSFNEFRIFRKFCPQGYLIGNPLTDVDYDFNSFVPFAHGMGLISTDMYEVSGSDCIINPDCCIPKSIDRPDTICFRMSKRPAAAHSSAPWMICARRRSTECAG
jgi:hypothetical protein